MNEAPIKPQHGPAEFEPSKLSEPHFDDLAVLIAQPVEPIAKHGGDWFGWLEKPRMMIAILVVAGLVGTTALALTLKLPRQRQVDSGATQIQVQESPGETESPLGALDEQLKPTPPRTSDRKAGSGARSRHARSADTRPVARRVGVIVYGSSSDHP
jgi:hypothetical protein